MTNGENSACPNAEGGVSGSGGPAPAKAESEEPKQDQDELLLEGDLPPDHYLTHRPKMARCEACQEAKMYHRQCRRSLGENRAVRHNAKNFGDVITMDHIDSTGDLGISLSGNSVALVVRDIATGWLDGYPAGSKSAQDVVSALQNFVASTEKIRVRR